MVQVYSTSTSGMTNFEACQAENNGAMFIPQMQWNDYKRENFEHAKPENNGVYLFHKHEWNDYKRGNSSMPKPENMSACLFHTSTVRHYKEGKFRACQSQKTMVPCLFHKCKWNDYKRGNLNTKPENNEPVIFYSTSTSGMTTKEGKFRACKARKETMVLFIPQVRVE
ncbi:hypothetical protein AVEN_185192-1 [Araneus ventricosus]|uniref:Uncharacterized protein n=1 Tax=Araneus ventricosus TaxID=182803 RepID=A0A4Y2P5B7_ARAVE|nr:hypothetical protein AVEN_185192-1 [Araneus ventricosus]